MMIHRTLHRMFAAGLALSMVMGLVVVTGFVQTDLAAAECINLSGNGDTDRMLGPFAMPAGSTITATMTAGEGRDYEPEIPEIDLPQIESRAVQQAPTWGGTLILFYIDGVAQTPPSVQYTQTHTVSMTFDSDSQVEILLDWEFNGDPANTYTVVSDDCGGCDSFVPVPASAVGGLFVSDAPVYWAPGQLTSPQVTIEAGKTYRVIGQDTSGQYRQILLGCQFVWVPASSVGPDPNAPWSGAPLPTDVVE